MKPAGVLRVGAGDHRPRRPRRGGAVAIRWRQSHSRRDGPPRRPAATDDKRVALVVVRRQARCSTASASMPSADSSGSGSGTPSWTCAPPGNLQNTTSDEFPDQKFYSYLTDEGITVRNERLVRARSAPADRDCQRTLRLAAGAPGRRGRRHRAGRRRDGLLPERRVVAGEAVQRDAAGVARGVRHLARGRRHDGDRRIRCAVARSTGAKHRSCATRKSHRTSARRCRAGRRTCRRRRPTPGSSSGATNNANSSSSTLTTASRPAT